MHSISGPSNRLRGEALWLGYAEKDIEEGAILGLFYPTMGTRTIFHRMYVLNMYIY